MDLHESTAKDARKQRTLRRLGTDDNPACGTCGENDWRCLERHHIAGRKHDGETTVIVCRNCHRKLTDDQKAHPAPTGNDGSRFEVIGRFMLGLADLLALIVEKLRQFGKELIEQARGMIPNKGTVPA